MNWDSNTTRKKILIVSYFFPPNPDIGGRRWVKFAKHLTKKGHYVEVICAEFDSNASSPWDADNDGYIVHSLAPKYPKILNFVPKNIFQKISYKFWTIILPYLTKGNFHDRSLFWKKQFVKFTSKLIREKGFDELIVTGAPFHLFYFGTLLKKEFPKLKLSCDFRDPWTWGISWGIQHLDTKRQDFERTLEKKVVENSDRIFVPVAPMKEYFFNNYSESKDKIYLLPHAFDDELINRLIPRTKSIEPEKKKIRLLYYGSLYEEYALHFKKLAKALSLSKIDFKFEIYTFNKDRFKGDFEECDILDKIDYNDPIDEHQIFQKLKEVDYVFLFKMLHYGADNLSTKYYEIIETKKPIIIIGKGGLASQFLESNNLGVHFTIEDLEKGLPELLSGVRDFSYNTNYDNSKYSFSGVTDNLISILDQ